MAERVDHGGGHRLVGDGEILDRPRGRRAVQGIGRHLHLAHRVAFGAEIWSSFEIVEVAAAADARGFRCSATYC